ncbi:MAG: tetratricopeptide repeat protein, partial [Gemmataceae bacterium]
QAAFPQQADALRELKPTSCCPRCRKMVVLDEAHQTRHCPDCDGASRSIDAASPTEFDSRGYQLIETLGKGGMGEVYRSCDPALGRELAVKVVKERYHGDVEMERRFLREARVTGSLQHPSIVPVHNLGRLADGRLHYTMRLVRGQTFADILKDEGGKPERLPALLGIFEKICQAVAYAHSKRVIHRDLKPANVMVGKFGEVQVMDWGLAKLLSIGADTQPREPSDEVGTIIRTESVDTPSDLSRAGSAMGTAAYMSPEQARGKWDKVDERADVFALGSILCEMLTGRPAYVGASTELFDRVERGDVGEALERLEGCGADAALRALCRACLNPRREGRPRDAGAMAQRVAEYQAEVQERLRRAELERAEAQVKAREERKRRRLAISLVLVLLTGAGLSTTALAIMIWQAERATVAESKARENESQALQAKNRALELAEKSERLAEQEKKASESAKAEERKARTVGTFLESIFAASDPLGLTSNSLILPRVAGEKLLAQDLLERGAKKWEQELQAQPEIQAEILMVIGNSYMNLGEYKNAQPLLEKALWIREQLKDNSHGVAASMHALGRVYHALGNYDEAEKMYKNALGLCKESQRTVQLLGADVLFSLGWLLTEKEEHQEAESCFKICIYWRTHYLGRDNRLTALAQVGLAAVYLDLNDNMVEAVGLISQSIRTFQRLEGDRFNLARTLGLFQQGIIKLRQVETREEGVSDLVECLRILKESPLGSKHLYVAFVTGTLALELQRIGRAARAEPYFVECLAIVESNVGLWHPKLDSVALGYAALLIRQKKMQEANQFFDRVLKARQARYGEKHPKVANTLVSYALVRDKFDPEREKWLVRAREIYEKNQPLKGITSIRLYENCLNQLGVIALDIHHDAAEAVKIFQTAWQMFGHSAYIPPLELAVLQTNQAIALIEQANYLEAEKLLEAARVVCEKEKESDNQEVWKATLTGFAHLYLRQRQTGKVAAICRQRSERWPNDADQFFLTGRYLLECVPLLEPGNARPDASKRTERQQCLEEGIAACQKALELYEKSGGTKHPSYKFCLSWLSNGHFYQENYGQAEKLREQALALMREDLSSDHEETAVALIRLAEARLARKKLDRLERYLTEASDILLKKSPADHLARSGLLTQLGMLLLQAGKPAEAEPVLRKCLEIRAKKTPDDWLLFNTMSLLGGSLLGQKKYKDAELLLVQGYQGMMQRHAQIPLEGKVRLTEARERLVRLYEATEQKEKAAEWRKKLDETTAARTKLKP